MTKNVVSTGVNDSIFEATTNMSLNGQVLGDYRWCDAYWIGTEMEIVKRIAAKRLPLETNVSSGNSKYLIIIDPDASLKEAARLISTDKIRRPLSVLKQDRLVGIVELPILFKTTEKSRSPKKYRRL